MDSEAQQVYDYTIASAIYIVSFLHDVKDILL